MVIREEHHHLKKQKQNYNYIMSITIKLLKEFTIFIYRKSHAYYGADLHFLINASANAIYPRKKC